MVETTYDVGVGFSYNPASQVVARSQTNGTYDYPIGVVNQTYTRNGLNQYTQIAGTNGGTLAWDANGNLTSDGFTTFAYDTENRLTGASGAKTATLTYDPMGRLQQVSNTGGTTRFLYDGDRLISEYNTSGAVQRRYVHGVNVDEPMVWYEGSTVSSATRRYLHADHLGSIVATANAAGTKLDIGTYDAYGVTTAPSTWRFQYTGQTAIQQVGLYYYKARFYNPSLGRFMQTDPIGYDDDLNLYAYVGNDPLNRTDPSGNFGQGMGFTESQWRKFDKAQQRAAANMEHRASMMEKRADKLDSKGQCTEKASNLRTGASNLRAGAADLRGTSKLAIGMTTKQYIAAGNGRTSAGGAAAAAPDGNSIYVNLGNSNAWGAGNSTAGAWSAGHESLHTGAGLSDMASNGSLSYGLSSDPAQKGTFNSLRGTAEGMTKPDNLMDLAFPGYADKFQPD